MLNHLTLDHKENLGDGIWKEAEFDHYHSILHEEDGEFNHFHISDTTVYKPIRKIGGVRIFLDSISESC